MADVHDMPIAERCGELLIERDWYVLGGYNLTDDGDCRSCGMRCAGVYSGPAGAWGRQRLPIHMGA